MSKRIVAKWKRRGVVLHSAKSVRIDDRVEIERGATIEDGVTILGDSHIGKGAFIGSGSYLDNAMIGKDTIVLNSRITNAYIGDSSTVGPYAHVHKCSKIAGAARIGNFVEIKNSDIGIGTKIAHLAYVGDADIGERCNIGCGAIFVNYDGKKKRRSTLGDMVFVGSNANIVAPVHLDDGAYIAAGSTVTCDIGRNDMCIARAREVIKADRSKYRAEER